MSTPRSFLLAGGLFVGSLADAQLGLIQAEYFWDADPGVGNGTAMSSADGAFGSAVEDILTNTGSLPATGTHTFHVRVRDEDNGWGPVFSTLVEVWEPSTPSVDINVQIAEYFWDNDPGAGSGTVMLAFDGDFDSAVETISMISMPFNVQGPHVLGVRAQDANGGWGPVFRVVIDVWESVTMIPDISVQSAEYFFDTDPGAGFATPMLAADGDFSDVWEALQGGGIPPVEEGVRVLHIRAQDIQGDWGPTFRVVVNIDTTVTDNVGIAGSSPISYFSVHPNPAEGDHRITVDLGSTETDIILTLMDPAGRLVFDQRLARASLIPLSLDGLVPGVYALRMQCATRTEKRKLILR